MLSSIELKNAHLLVLSTKQDLPTCTHATKITEILQLEKIDTGANGLRKWHNQPCETIEGGGLDDGLEWLSERLIKKGKQRNK